MQCLTSVVHSLSQAKVMLEHGHTSRRKQAMKKIMPSRHDKKFASFDMQQCLLETYEVILKEDRERSWLSSNDLIGDLLLTFADTCKVT